MQKAVVTAEQAKIQVGQLLMGSSFMTLDGKMGKLLEYIRETELVKVLVYEIGKDMGVEILWPLDVLVYTTPKQVPVPAAVEPWTAKAIGDIPVASLCDIDIDGRIVTVRIVEHFTDEDKIDCTRVVEICTGKRYTMGNADIECYPPSSTIGMVDPSPMPTPEQEGSKVDGDSAIADIATDEERFEIMTPWGKATAVRETTSEQKHDPVNSPSHYTKGKIETIDFIEATGLGFHLGNAVKYLSRAGLKGNLVEDLKKARWYVQRATTFKGRLQEVYLLKPLAIEYCMSKELNYLQSCAIIAIVDTAYDHAVGLINEQIRLIEADKI